MNKEIRQAIELLEKIIKPLDACEPQCKLNLNPKKIRQVIILLKQQPPAGEFTKECRGYINGSPNMSGVSCKGYAERLSVAKMK